jgi:predicted N-acetyltransferase YhbS
MNITIRQERESDYKQSEYVVEKAFENAEYSDHKEQFLVAGLRKSDAFIPELSLVAEHDGKVTGHIMLTRLHIMNGEKSYESLALAPVSVLPEYQNLGLGSILIIESLRIAKEIGFKSVIVLGHEKYYPRFGFKPASLWGIKAPFDVPDENFMALELENGSLEGTAGMVVYPKEFLV